MPAIRQSFRVTLSGPELSAPAIGHSATKFGAFEAAIREIAQPHHAASFIDLFPKSAYRMSHFGKRSITVRSPDGQNSLTLEYTPD
ncbi:hypothetical protein WYO_0144 [Methylobacterium sp. GXF4]|uniref:hypothetical protein n=1 Tax=Methylobacterium sp. GXF4 TaxID=1096546 RepID=UPI0002698C39|nr:hypothetical protein [Methylobacterium sp. GXF4]EIZ87107.1 hypothetical protein WYO_0144 [Methylobacterium sp. GXF4]